MKKSFVIKLILILVFVYSSATAINYKNQIDVANYAMKHTMVVTSMGKAMSQESITIFEQFLLETNSTMYLTLKNTLYTTSSDSEVLKLKRPNMRVEEATIQEIFDLSKSVSIFNTKIDPNQNQFQLKQHFSQGELSFPTFDNGSMDNRFNEFLLFQYSAIILCSFTALVYCLINEINRQKRKFAILTSLGHGVFDIYKELYLKETVVECLVFIGSILAALAYFKYSSLVVPLILFSLVFMFVNIVINLLIIKSIKQNSILKYKTNSIGVSYFQVVISIVISVVFINAFSQLISSSMQSYQFSSLLKKELPKYENTYLLGSSYSNFDYQVINENNRQIANSFEGSFSFYYGAKYSDLIEVPLISASANYFIHNQYSIETCDNQFVDFSNIEPSQFYAIESIIQAIQEQNNKFEGNIQVMCLAKGQIYFDLMSGKMAKDPIIRLSSDNAAQNLFVTGDKQEIIQKIAEIYGIDPEKADISPVSEPLNLRYKTLVDEQLRMIPVLVSTLVTLLLLFSNIAQSIASAYKENIRVKHIMGYSLLSKYIYFILTFIVMLIVPVLFVSISHYSLLKGLIVIFSYVTLLAIVMLIKVITLDKNIKESIKDGD